ncbi:MAG: hydrogenase expression/formation protein HypE [Pseudomonadota bacterium]
MTTRRLPRERVLLDHGAGSRAAHDLITSLFISRFANDALGALEDAAVLDPPAGRLAFTTDSYVIDPIFFPGGNIGSLAVHGTVNDLAMRGARPLYLSCGFIIEEGMPLSELEEVVGAMAEAARGAGVLVVAGDTKVVPRGAADRLFINTAGIGLVPDGLDVSCRRARPGDAVLISGTIGDHGVAVLSRREGLAFSTPVESDSAPLNGLVAGLLEAGLDVHVLRDPTRGGLATTLNEIADSSRVGMVLFEDRIPCLPAVVGACEILGLDPLYIANEGKCVVILPAPEAQRAFDAMRAHPYGSRAAVIGEVVERHPGRIYMRTRIGGSRLLDMLAGEQLPRIC